jgi:hypothetical protein
LHPSAAAPTDAGLASSSAQTRRARVDRRVPPGRGSRDRKQGSRLSGPTRMSSAHPRHGPALQLRISSSSSPISCASRLCIVPRAKQSRHTPRPERRLRAPHARVGRSYPGAPRVLPTSAPAGRCDDRNL